MLKKGLGLGLLFLCISVHAKQFFSFDELAGYLSYGNSMRVVVDMGSCQVDDPNQYKLPTHVMVTKPQSVIIGKELIGFDASKYTHGRPPIPENGFMQRASFLLNKNGDLQIVLSFFDAATNEKYDAFKDVHIQCALGDGLMVFSE